MLVGPPSASEVTGQAGSLTKLAPGMSLDGAWGYAPVS
jgi:hypothetical protein